MYSLKNSILYAHLHQYIHKLRAFSLLWYKQAKLEYIYLFIIFGLSWLAVFVVYTSMPASVQV